MPNASKNALGTYRAHPIDAELASVLPVGALFAVGGRVRDELRAAIEEIPTQSADLDYVVTGVALADLAERLAKIGRVDIVGATFAVLKVSLQGVTVDVALPRREQSTGPGHREFSVQSGPDIPLGDDLGRRDFRMNMLARALPSGELIDPYGGESDIRAHRIDILTPRSFSEDPLRMLRAVQFSARFSYKISDGTLQAAIGAAPLIVGVSPQRIAEEMSKLLLLAPAPSVGFEALRSTGLLQHIWPELLEGIGVEQNEWHAYDVWQHAMATVDASPPGDLIARLAALLHDVGKPRTKIGPHFYRHEAVGAEIVRGMLARLRFSNDVIDTTVHLVRQHMYSADPEMRDPVLRRFVRRVGIESLTRQFGLRQADIVGSGLPKRDDSNERFEARVWAEIAREPPFSIADLKVSGDDVIDAMVSGGFASAEYRGDWRVGVALRWLFEQVTDEPERNDRETLLTLLGAYLRERGPAHA